MFRYILLLLLTSFSLTAQAWVEFKLEGGHIKMPITANGIEAYAILDTGSQLNAINNRFRKAHNLDLKTGNKIEVVGVYGKETRSTYNGLNVGMFGTEVKMDGLAGLNFGGSDVAILLGETFLEQFIVQIDYPNSRLRIVPHDTWDMSEIENIKLVKQRGTGKPLVSVTMNKEVDVWLLLDTGNAGGVMVERSLAKSNGWLKEYETTELYARGANTSGINEAFRISELQFGPYALEDVLVTVPAEGESANIAETKQASFSRIKGKRVRGILGYDVLQHFLLTIDYRSGNANISIPPPASQS